MTTIIILVLTLALLIYIANKTLPCHDTGPGCYCYLRKNHKGNHNGVVRHNGIDTVKEWK